MHIKHTFIVIIIAAVTIAAAFGAVAYNSASAAESTPTTPEILAGGRGPGDGLRDGVSDENLAAALGISMEELEAAREEARAAVLAQAVEDGLITQAQADAISTGERPLSQRLMGAWLSENGVDYQAALAEALGISTEELQAARLQALEAQLAQAVADGEMTQERADLVIARRTLAADGTFQSSMQSAFETALQQAVDSGVITQEQADLILEAQAGHSLFDFGGGRGGSGGHGGHGGHGGPGRMDTDADPSSTTP